MPAKSYTTGSVWYADGKDFLVLGNNCLSLKFSKESGQLCAVSDGAGNPAASSASTHGAFELFEGGKIIQHPPKFSRYYATEYEGLSSWGKSSGYLGFSTVILSDKVEFSVRFGDERWTITSKVIFEEDSSRVKFDWEILFNAETPSRLGYFTFTLPEIVDKKSLISLPGASSVPDSAFGEMPPLVYFKFGAFIRNREDTRTFAFWASDDSFMNLNKCEKSSGSLKLSASHYAEGFFRKGTAIRCGSDYIQIRTGTMLESVDRFTSVYPEKGFSDTVPVQEYARESVIFEAGAGAILFDPDFSYAPYPKLSDLKKDLERIRDLGFNTIQLMPCMPFPWYTVYHYGDIAENYGAENETELEEFIRKVHSLGMRFLFDIVVHGVSDGESSRKGLERYAVRNRLFHAGLDKEFVNTYRKEHPEWFRRDMNGEISFIHTWSLEFAVPSLRAFFFDHLKRCVTQFKCDGFRFDAPYWGCEGNYSKDYPYWPGSSFTSNVKMLREAKYELLKLKSDLLWYTEHEHAEWRAYMDMTYTYEESWLLWRPEPGKKLPIYEGTIDASKMALWFELRRRALPRRQIALQHHIDSHDSWWNEAKSAFGRDKFGTAEALLLTGFCMLTDGAFLAFAGAEKGSEEFFRRILTLRNSLPALRKGSCDYLKCTTDHPKVIALYRESEGSSCIPVFNFSGERVKCVLSLKETPPDFAGTLRNLAGDGKSSGEISSFHRGKNEIRLVIPPNALMVIAAENMP